MVDCLLGANVPVGEHDFVDHSFWYQTAPPDILTLLTSTFNHPLMELGRVAVNACPTTPEAADLLYRGRFN